MELQSLVEKGGMKKSAALLLGNSDQGSNNRSQQGPAGKNCNKNSSAGTKRNPKRTTIVTPVNSNSEATIYDNAVNKRK